MKPSDPLPDWDEELHKLVQLRDEGIVTTEEFEEKKTEILTRV
jgi:hypothetical protein